MRETVTDHIGARSWLTLAVLVAMLVVSYLDRGLIALFVGPIRENLSISEVQLSLLYGMALGLFYVVFAFTWAQN